MDILARIVFMTYTGTFTGTRVHPTMWAFQYHRMIPSDSDAARYITMTTTNAPNILEISYVIIFGVLVFVLGAVVFHLLKTGLRLFDEFKYHPSNYSHTN
jgi:hypothetical protein